MNHLDFPRNSVSEKVLSLRVRKYWYLCIPVLMLIGGLVYLGLFLDMDYQDLLKQYGYHIVLAWTFLEGKTIVIVTGMLAYSLDLNPWIIALCAFIGSSLIDQIMFFLGKKKGDAFLNRFPSFEARVDKVVTLFKKYDIALMLGFRFITGMRNITPVILGVSGVGHKKFFLLNIIGAAIWSVAYTFGGVYSGKAFIYIMNQVSHGAFYVSIAFATLFAAWMVYRKKARTS